MFNFSLKTATKAAPRAKRSLSGLQVLLQAPPSRNGGRRRGPLIAFTSASPGEGVSHVVRYFAEQLAAHTGGPTLVIDAVRLRNLQAADFMNLPGRCLRTKVDNLWLLPHELAVKGNGNRPTVERDPDSESGLDHLNALSLTFSHTLVDCPSISSSYEAALLAPEVDGVILVVEADRTRKHQILRARQTIEMAHGKLIGMVLNKRRFVVPEWFYRLM